MQAIPLTGVRLSVRQRAKVSYLLYEPPSRPRSTRHAPLILFLHGAGERGADLNLVKKHGIPRRIEEGVRFPFYTVAPQCPAGAIWDAVALEALLDRLLKTLPVDADRVYVTGLSMGGAGAWAVAYRCPEKIAAVAPICAPFQYLAPERLRNIPAWCFHGAMDIVVPVDDSVRMVRLLRNAGARVRFTVYPDADHDSWTATYANPDFYAWLLRQRRRGPLRSCET